MFKKVTKILGVIALTGWMGAANATLIFDFSWDGRNGIVTGEVLGLADNARNQQASGVLITSVNGIPSAPSVDFFDSTLWDIDFNSFDVFGGQIVFNDFIASSSPASADGSFRLVSYDHVAYIPRNSSVGYWDNLKVGVPFVNRVTVPEPSSVILLSLGLAGLSFARYRKQY
jgi:hypothetical protein